MMIHIKMGGIHRHVSENKLSYFKHLGYEVVPDEEPNEEQKPEQKRRGKKTPSDSGDVP